ncbi:MAG: hypothetical protein VX265_05490, partial [Myxococcota bacterium]|nr:hypothetical protein [Myxococcota bacterium]
HTASEADVAQAAEPATDATIAPDDAPVPAPAGEETPAPTAARPSLSRADLQDPIHMLMLETVGRMSACYEGAESPPPVVQLRALVEARDYETIRSDFGDLWNDLIAFHRDEGTQLQPKVSHTFRTIDTIVRNL